MCVYIYIYIHIYISIHIYIYTCSQKSTTSGDVSKCAPSTS